MAETDDVTTGDGLRMGAEYPRDLWVTRPARDLRPSRVADLNRLTENLVRRRKVRCECGQDIERNAHGLPSCTVGTNWASKLLHIVKSPQSERGRPWPLGLEKPPEQGNSPAARAVVAASSRLRSWGGADAGAVEDQAAGEVAAVQERAVRDEQPDAGFEGVEAGAQRDGQAGRGVMGSPGWWWWRPRLGWPGGG
jgi:hypothetical protein